MIKILLYADSPNDGTSFYRAVAPFQLMQSEYDNIYYEVISGHTHQIHDWNIWNLLWQFDIVVMQRPATHYALNLMTAALELELPVILDFDDALLHVPMDNPASDYFNAAETQRVIRQILLLRSSNPDAVQLMTSTAHLGKMMEGCGSVKATVIPNALKIDKLYAPRFAVATTSQHEVSWRGSKTHEKDLLVYRDQIYSSFKSVEYIGYQPLIKRQQDEVINGKPIIRYYIEVLKKRSRKFFFVTLEDNPFNYAKSSIAWIESTWAGAVCLAPDWPEWQRPGIINYTDQNDFCEKAEGMLSLTDKQREEHWLASNDYIMQNLTLSNVNKLRYELIKSMVK